MAAWTDPAWRLAADAWIAEQLNRLGASQAGEIDQLHVYPWSTVMRVPTRAGDVYFKANSPPLAHEAALVTALANRRPDCVPPLLAADLDRGWMLMADAGTQLRALVAAERSLRAWSDVLPLYAGLQIDFVDEADALVGLGVPDLRLPLLGGKYEALLDELDESDGLPADDRRRLREDVPRVRDMCEELAGYGPPDTIEHDDFHDGQVYVRDGRYQLLDWGDACVSHPFFTMAVTLGGVITWGVDDVQGSVDPAPFRAAYLGPFARYGDLAELGSACAIAERLGWVCRAVNAHLGGAELEQTHRRLQMFLDDRP